MSRRWRGEWQYGALLLMLRTLIELPRWLFLALLVYAPWAYGCTRAWALEILIFAMLSMTGLWLVGCAARRQWPSIHPVCLVFTVLLLIQGWWMALNAHFSYDPEFFQFVPANPIAPGLPGSLDRDRSLASMWRVTGLLGVLCFAADLLRRALWRRLVWWTVVLTGASIAIFGIAVRVIEADAARTAFATYRYHANAGAFLNLVLPPAAAMVAVAFGPKGTPVARAVSAPALLAIIAAAFVNVSKASMLLAVLILVALASRELPRLRVLFTSQSIRLRLVQGALIAIVVAGTVAVVGRAQPWRRWAQLPALLNSDNPRLLVAQVCTRMIGDGGVFGLGPGTFATAFPHYSQPLGERVSGVWRYAHQDYLQTTLEWGYVGMTCWGVLFAGGCFAAFRAAARSRGAGSADRALSFAGGVALTGIALHALVDFPLQIGSLQLYTATLLALGWSSARAA